MSTYEYQSHFLQYQDNPWQLPTAYNTKLFLDITPSCKPMESGRLSRSNQPEQRIDAIRQLPLEPMEYCRRWVEIDPSRGYKKACINALAQATGLSPNTIKDWGSNFNRRPRYIPFVLRQADLINQFKQLVITGRIILPSNFPSN